MVASTPPADQATAGVSPAVLAAAGVAAFAVLPVVPVFVYDLTATVLVELAAWPPLAVVGALALDRHPRWRPAWVCVGLATVGWLIIAVALVDQPSGFGLEQTVRALGPWPALVTVLAVGALFVPAGDRDSRRRRVWMLTAVVMGVAAVTAAWWFLPAARAGAVSVVTVWLIGLTVAALMLADDLRPIDEPLLDLGAGLAVAAAAAGAGLLVRLGGQLSGFASGNVFAVLAAVSAAVLAAPGVWWLRRTLRTRRYGSGILHPADVAAITEDLDRNADPRALLGKAAAMVARASGSERVEILLGDDQPDEGDDQPTSSPQWTAYPMVVGSRRVGTLLVATPHREGPERRQRQVIGQLLPTVALVGRAVTLAVEAEHARQDVSRQRDAERARILADLHDDLGPVLAGMSMRVQAARRSHSEHWLDELANDLAASRADLRRIVAGLTPSALDDGDLARALDRLVASYRQPSASPQVTVVGTAPNHLSPAAAATVYRTVAEGITNGIRHAHATGIAVTIGAVDGRVRVEVTDDGVGGPITPGVGLTSLRRRAEGLGGTLTASSQPGAGTRLVLDLPGATA